MIAIHWHWPQPAFPCPSPEILTSLEPEWCRSTFSPPNVIALQSCPEDPIRPTIPGEFGGRGYTISPPRGRADRGFPQDHRSAASTTAKRPFENGLTYFGSRLDGLGLRNNRQIVTFPSFLQAIFSTVVCPLDQNPRWMPRGVLIPNLRSHARSIDPADSVPLNLWSPCSATTVLPGPIFSAQPKTGGLRVEVGDPATLFQVSLPPPSTEP